MSNVASPSLNKIFLRRIQIFFYLRAPHRAVPGKRWSRHQRLWGHLQILRPRQVNIFRGVNILLSICKYFLGLRKCARPPTFGTSAARLASSTSRKNFSGSFHSFQQFIFCTVISRGFQYLDTRHEQWFQWLLLPSVVVKLQNICRRYDAKS